MEKFYLMIYFYSKGLSLIFYVCDTYIHTHTPRKKENEQAKSQNDGPENIYNSMNVKNAYLRIAYKTGTRSELQQQQQQQRKKWSEKDTRFIAIDNSNAIFHLSIHLDKSVSTIHTHTHTQLFLFSLHSLLLLPPLSTDYGLALNDVRY